MILFKSHNGKYKDNRELYYYRKCETDIKLKSNQIKT